MEDYTSIPEAASRFSLNGQSGPHPIAFDDLNQKYTKQEPMIIDGLLREGETMNVISHTKVGKSWLVLGLMLSIATGREWLGRKVQQGRVLLIDNELRPATLAHRIREVAAAMGIPHHEIGDTLEVLSLRGQLMDIDGLITLLSNIEPETYRMVAIDAWYRILPRGISENSNADIAHVYNDLDKIATHLRCGIACVHHTSKGMQDIKRVTDVGSGAGSQSRAADTHLVLREHEQPDCFVMDAAVRSIAPVKATVLRWEYPTWTVAEGLDANALKQRNGGRSKAEERRKREDAKAIKRLADILADGPKTRRRLRTLAGMGDERINRLVASMRDEGTVDLMDDGTGKELITLTGGTP